MTVEVDPGLREYIEAQWPYWIGLMVQGAPDPRLAAQALDRSGEEIQAFGARFVTEAQHTPIGPYFEVNLSGMPAKHLRSLVDVVVDNLESLGVRSGRLIAPEVGGCVTRGLEMLPRAVMLHLCPPPPEWPPSDPRYDPREVPLEWLGDAVSWLTEGLAEDFPLWGSVKGFELAVPVREAMAFFDKPPRRSWGYDVLVAGAPRPKDPPPPTEPTDLSWRELEPLYTEPLGGRIRTMALHRHSLPFVMLAAGGPDATDEELVAYVERFIELAQPLAPALGYAYVSIWPNFGPFHVGSLGAEWNSSGRESEMRAMCDEVVFDAFPYQILTPRHLRRLGGVPPGSRPLEGDRVELSIGKPQEWLIVADGPGPGREHVDLGHRRKDRDIQDRGRDLLAPCLAPDDQKAELLRKRWERTHRMTLGLPEEWEPGDKWPDEQQQRGGSN